MADDQAGCGSGPGAKAGGQECGRGWLAVRNFFSFESMAVYTTTGGPGNRRGVKDAEMMTAKSRVAEAAGAGGGFYGSRAERVVEMPLQAVSLSPPKAEALGMEMVVPAGVAGAGGDLREAPPQGPVSAALGQSRAAVVAPGAEWKPAPMVAQLPGPEFVPQPTPVELSVSDLPSGWFQKLEEGPGNMALSNAGRAPWPPAAAGVSPERASAGLPNQRIIGANVVMSGNSVVPEVTVGDTGLTGRLPVGETMKGGAPDMPAKESAPLWQGLTTLGEEGEVVDRFMNGDWLVRTGPERKERVFRDVQVASMTGMRRGELESFIQQHGVRKGMVPEKEAYRGARTAPHLAGKSLEPSLIEGSPRNASQAFKPASRPDRSARELYVEVAEATGKKFRLYPQSAEQAIANISAEGRDLTEGEAAMIYSQYNQKYPGWGRMERADPTVAGKAAPRPAVNEAAFVPNVRAVPSPAVRADKSFSQIQREVAAIAIERSQEYPRTAEQAIANLWEDGKDVTSHEAEMIYSMFRQKYPGWTNMRTVNPTGKVLWAERRGPSEQIMRAARPSELLDSANAEFNAAVKDYLWAPERWAKGKYLGIADEPLTFDETHAWTQVLKGTKSYSDMRKELVQKVRDEDRSGTLSTLIGWRPSKSMRALRWDDSADKAPLLQPVYDLLVYATGMDLKSTGSVKGDMVITQVDRGNRTFTAEVTLSDELRSGSMTRIPGRIPLVGDKEILKDNSAGPFFYTLPLRWKWTETLNY